MCDLSKFEFRGSTVVDLDEKGNQSGNKACKVRQDNEVTSVEHNLYRHYKKPYTYK